METDDLFIKIAHFCRYKRRGIDEDGNVANYVETEQILSFGEHQMSFFQIRGSVPVFWSQPGYKYRPPPRIDRGARCSTGPGAAKLRPLFIHGLI